MNLESFIPFLPFLAVLYVAFALIQSLRKKQQGVGAALLAFVALAVPLAALVLIQDAAIRSAILNNLTLNAVIVFIGSIVVLMIEGRNSTRSANRSYGMLGIGLGVLIAVAALAIPAFLDTTESAQTTALSSLGGIRSDTSTYQNVSQTTSSTSPTAFAELLSAQTGLTTEELTTQLESGNKVADLVMAHNGDLNVVITAAASALDELKNQGGMPTQMLSNLGDDTTAVATQFVQGELEERSQQFLVRLLLTGGVPTPPQNGQIPPSNASGTPGANAPFTSQFSSAETTPDIPSSGQTANQVAVAPTVQPTESVATPAEDTIRPTLISFPSPTPTSIGTQVSIQAESTEQPATTCTVTPIYNLNLRDKPSTDSTIYLSIPYGTQIVADGRTADDWYSVTYNGQQGWASGEYLSKVAACADLAVVNASS